MLLRAEIFDDDHLPRQLLHRERESKQLLAALDPGPDGADRGHAVISGPSGVGKTVLTKHCCRRLRSERSVDTAYVRCLGSETGTVLRDTVEALGHGSAVGHTTPVEDVVDELHAAVERTAVVVLDEADDLPERAVEHLTDVRGVSVAMICHEPERWYSSAGPDVRERLRAGTQLSLERYGVTELADILERRAEVGLDRGAVRREHLERIADDVAGVARLGIQSLRCAAEIALEDGRDHIVDADLEPARERAKREIREANMRSLPFRYQFLYAVIRDAGAISSNAIYDRYEDVGDQVWQGRRHQPPSNRTIRDHLGKLRQYDLIDSADGVHRPTDPELAPAHEDARTAPTTPRNRH